MSKAIQITQTVSVGGSGPSAKLLFIAGPCQIESLDHALMMAESLMEITKDFPVNLVYKSSFDKANRTSLQSERGPGIEKGLKILRAVRERTGLPIITDIHTVEQAKLAAEVVDILQIPAFLCRQTDLLIGAAETGKTLNIKKGQFLAPEDMSHVAEKVASTGNTNILLCERGTSHGYRDLVVDMRSLIIMAETDYPVIFDATHSVQSMGGRNGQSGGAVQYIIPLARAATAVGIDGLFVECHQDPPTAPSDSASMLPLPQIKTLLTDILPHHQVS